MIEEEEKESNPCQETTGIHWGFWFWTKVLMSGSTEEQKYAMRKMDEWFVEDQRKNIKWPLSQPEDDKTLML